MISPLGMCSLAWPPLLPRYSRLYPESTVLCPPWLYHPPAELYCFSTPAAELYCFSTPAAELYCFSTPPAELYCFTTPQAELYCFSTPAAELYCFTTPPAELYCFSTPAEELYCFSTPAVELYCFSPPLDMFPYQLLYFDLGTDWNFQFKSCSTVSSEFRGYCGAHKPMLDILIFLGVTKTPGNIFRLIQFYFLVFTRDSTL